MGFQAGTHAQGYYCHFVSYGIFHFGAVYMFYE